MALRKSEDTANLEALDRTLWRNCCGGGYGPVLRQNAE